MIAALCTLNMDLKAKIRKQRQIVSYLINNHKAYIELARG